ncbi:hypothetical protein OG455_30255 [Kitasatospora sp. NBC_01287]|uniref:hypothetical protein n=1 Tax=Kitasatospora sp. NBC_01287 TaxID=2903573 RepID=UPI00224DF090|nr:hypothetical protein [Kitasatospora sp. NBC_01287]MCX4749746.1 hypothetical protein [Kitasatospora sp. NBC_01287]
MSSASSQEKDRDGTTLEVAYRLPSPVAMLPALLLPLLPSVRLLFSGDQLSTVLGYTDIVLVVAALGFVLTVLRRQRAQEWALRLDAAGVTVRGAGTVPWSELREVRSVAGRGLRPAVVVFTARPGVVLAAFPTMLPFARSERRATALVKKYGGPLVVPSAGLSASLPEVLAAVRRCGEVPVRTG